MKIPVLELFPAKSKLMSLAVVFCCLLLLFPAPARAEVWHQSNGNSQDVNPPLVGPVSDLGGGGTDVDRAIQWAIDQVRGCQD
ncbi:MAG: peptidase S51, partial [Microcystis sp.]